MSAILRDRPLIVTRLNATGPDPGYTVYGEAYGLEMGYDPDWRVTLVVLAPPEHFRQLTKNADVKSMGMQAGVSSPPPDLGQLPPDADWVMVEGTDGRANLDAVLATGRRCVVSARTDLTGLTTEQLARVVVVAVDAEVGRFRVANPRVLVVLAGGSAGDVHSAGADGLFTDSHFGDVLAACKTLTRVTP